MHVSKSVASHHKSYGQIYKKYTYFFGVNYDVIDLICLDHQNPSNSASSGGATGEYEGRKYPHFLENLVI